MNHPDDQMPTEESTALQRIDNPPPAIRQEVEMVREITPAQARVESVALVLNSAYQNASKLTLTPEEAQRLMADFDDSDIRSGARGDSSLIYLEHAAVRRRLMEVFGPGQWTIINRRSWLDESGGWLYADTVLVCRGCFVGECIGAMRYSPKNSRTNYADAVKGAESDALGRIAGTALGVGLKLWSKEFCDGWHQRQNAARNAPRQQQGTRPQPAPKPAPQANQERKPVTSGDVLPTVATEARRKKVYDYLVGMFGPDDLHAFNDSKGWVNEWPLKDVPASNQDLSRLVQEINDFIAARQCLPAQDVSENLDMPPEIANAIITVPRRGMKRDTYRANPDTIGSLYQAMKAGDHEAQKRLYGLSKNWTPEPYVSESGKKYPVSQEDFDCRVALDAFNEWQDRKGQDDVNESGLSQGYDGRVE